MNQPSALTHPWRGLLLGALVLMSAAHPLRAGSLQLLSVRDPSVPASASGNGDSIAPWLSADGRFVVFASSASDLVPGDNGLFTLDLFLRDRLDQSNTLITVNLTGTGGGN